MCAVKGIASVGGPGQIDAYGRYELGQLRLIYNTDPARMLSKRGQRSVPALSDNAMAP